MGSGRSKSVWVSASERAMQDVRKTHNELMKQLLEGKLDATNRHEIQDFLTRSNTEAIARNRDLCQVIWTRYDVNRDGFLSKEETKVLTKDALTECKNFAPVLVREVVQQTIKTTKVMVRKMAAASGQKLSEKQLEAVDATFGDVSKQQLDTTLQQLDALLIDYERVADELWTKMDANADGRVTEDEFLLHYQHAANALFDQKAAMQQLVSSQSVRSNPSHSHSGAVMVGGSGASGVGVGGGGGGGTSLREAKDAGLPLSGSAGGAAVSSSNLYSGHGGSASFSGSRSHSGVGVGGGGGGGGGSGAPAGGSYAVPATTTVGPSSSAAPQQWLGSKGTQHHPMSRNGDGRSGGSGGGSAGQGFSLSSNHHTGGGPGTGAGSGSGAGAGSGSGSRGGAAASGGGMSMTAKLAGVQVNTGARNSGDRTSHLHSQTQTQTQQSPSQQQSQPLVQSQPQQYPPPYQPYQHPNIPPQLQPLPPRAASPQPPAEPPVPNPNATHTTLVLVKSSPRAELRTLNGAAAPAGVNGNGNGNGSGSTAPGAQSQSPGTMLSAALPAPISTSPSSSPMPFSMQSTTTAALFTGGGSSAGASGTPSRGSPLVPLEPAPQIMQSQSAPQSPYGVQQPPYGQLPKLSAAQAQAQAQAQAPAQASQSAGPSYPNSPSKSYLGPIAGTSGPGANPLAVAPGGSVPGAPLPASFTAGNSSGTTSGSGKRGKSPQPQQPAPSAGQPQQMVVGVGPLFGDAQQSAGSGLGSGKSRRS